MMPGDAAGAMLNARLPLMEASRLSGRTRALSLTSLRQQDEGAGSPGREPSVSFGKSPLASPSKHHDSGTACQLQSPNLLSSVTAGSAAWENWPPAAMGGCEVAAIHDDDGRASRRVTAPARMGALSAAGIIWERSHGECTPLVRQVLTFEEIAMLKRRAGMEAEASMRFEGRAAGPWSSLAGGMTPPNGSGTGSPR